MSPTATLINPARLLFYRLTRRLGASSRFCSMSGGESTSKHFLDVGPFHPRGGRRAHRRILFPAVSVRKTGSPRTPPQIPIPQVWRAWLSTRITALLAP